MIANSPALFGAHGESCNTVYDSSETDAAKHNPHTHTHTHTRRHTTAGSEKWRLNFTWLPPPLLIKDHTALLLKEITLTLIIFIWLLWKAGRSISWRKLISRIGWVFKWNYAGWPWSGCIFTVGLGNKGTGDRLSEKRQPELTNFFLKNLQRQSGGGGAHSGIRWKPRIVIK